MPEFGFFYILFTITTTKRPLRNFKKLFLDIVHIQNLTELQPDTKWAEYSSTFQYSYEKWVLNPMRSESSCPASLPGLRCHYCSPQCCYETELCLPMYNSSLSVMGRLSLSGPLCEWHIGAAFLGSFHSLLPPKSPEHFVCTTPLTQILALLWQDAEEMCNSETEWERGSPQRVVREYSRKNNFLLNKNSVRCLDACKRLQRACSGLEPCNGVWVGLKATKNYKFSSSADH